MPRERRANIGRRTRHASQQQVYSRNLREERKNIIRENDRLRHRVSTRRSLASYNRLAFQYDPTANYSDDENLDIGRMTTICRYCNAVKFKRETVGLCCASRKVKLDPLLTPPQPLKTLFDGSDPDSSHFLQHILEYNNCFRMTSFGANIIREGGFMPTCKIQGQIYHLHGSMVPTPDQLNVRCNIQGAQQLKRRIIEQLQAFFHANNAVVNMFKTALERMPSDTHKFVIRADCTPTGEHVRRFNAPTVNDVAAIIVGDPTKSRDIVVQRRSNIMHRVNETHRLYDALQYPIIYWQGQDGYDITLKMVDPITGVSTNNKNLSAMNYYAYRMMIRTHEENVILKCGRLFQQFAVDMYVKVETERLAFIRFNQPKLRSEDYIHLRDAIHSDGDVQNIGRLTILPSTYIGSPRHMHEYAQDAMTYVRNYGTPDLFITVTCNPKWTEIERELEPGQKPQDRHDIIARVFQQKLKVMMDVLTKYRVFGDTRCYMYSVEWQKRGLPHAHILIWLLNKLHSNEVDDIISAEIPDPVTDPRLHDIVTTQMVHGPCGALNPLSPCMADGKCTKRYPRPLVAETVTGNDGYPVYRRRSKEDNGRTIKVKVQNQEIEIGNEFIVPYCPLLSRIFETHANVESCHSAKSIKYLCKYVTKGSDMAVFGIASENVNDEISNFQMGRYVSTNEALWRLLSFQIHERYPTVVHLAVHLENGQRVYFTEANAAQRAERPPSTTLTSFFAMCEADPFAATLMYVEMPKYYTWNQSTKKFQRRKQGTPVPDWPQVFSTDALGRMYTVHPRNDECFYLRLLLVNVRGPKSFAHLKTVNGHQCQTYREACQLLGLLENDSHWDLTLADSVVSSNAYQIRTLFAIIITTCFPSQPIQLWNKYKDAICEDILHRLRIQTNNPDIQITDEIYNEGLILIEDQCLTIANKLLIEVGMIAPNRSMHDAFNQELNRELQYNVDTLQEFVRNNVPLLNEQQKQVYKTLMQAVDNNTGGLFFLDAPGGTGKTFVISLILATIRSRCDIALALASSGIAATLLDGGRTAHSALKLPLNLNTIDTPTCNISRSSAMGKLLMQCKLIVWDECTMAHNKSLEALNFTLKDLRRNNNIFGGLMILLAADFRQTLPVVPRGTPADELNACLKASPLWNNVKTLSLTTNMRVQLQNDQSAAQFSKQLLDLGNGKVPVDATSGLITLTNDFCRFVDTQLVLIENVFPNISENYKNYAWLSQRAILAAKNNDVHALNFTIQSKIAGDLVTYKSVDSITNPDDVVNYPTEFLNSLEIPGFPPHNLQLKVGTVILILRNLNPPRLCNGTRLSVKRLMPNLIEATIINGKYAGENVCIPRIPMIPTDLPFDFKRLQFPVRLAFAMTINKSQGQSLSVCGINLENHCFSHGQLYVACSRVGKPSALFVLTSDQKTKNVVYQRALQ
ncbi:uncharacterized protein LOC112680704 [Sipha flava]|uniref:ATP-dependent DNA helicase n=1 Tax=Sipha flava TaxID=143950 RepID=A0A8B8F894_9HEMI|nr:uncharacterized protein LOC112680704 [Sipha flava]